MGRGQSDSIQQLLAGRMFDVGVANPQARSLGLIAKTGAELVQGRSKATGHGFRHLASTWLNEQGYNADHIEKQLSHESRNKVRVTYNKAEYLKDRIKMMQDYADHIDGLK